MCVSHSYPASPSTIEFASTSLYRQEFDVNVFGVISTTQVFLPMIRAAGGRIVNVGSMAGFVPVPGVFLHIRQISSNLFFVCRPALIVPPNMRWTP